MQDTRSILSTTHTAEGLPQQVDLSDEEATKKMLAEKVPDASNVRRSIGHVSAAFAAYKEKFGLSRLILEMANESRIESESTAYIIVSIAYVCILAYYIRVNPPHPGFSIDWAEYF